MASRTRLVTRSWPNSSSTSESPGLTARPVTATRVAWIRAAAFKPRESASVP